MVQFFYCPVGPVDRLCYFTDPSNININPKLNVLLEKFHSYQCLCLVCNYLEVLEKITPVSKVFEWESFLESLPDLKLGMNLMYDALVQKNHAAVPRRL